MIANPSGRLVLGGVGWPHDDLLAAGLSSEGVHAEPLGPLDADSLERGRAALPRGQCAPMLHLTGALLRRAGRSTRPFTALSLQSCGPCRYSLFRPEHRRVLDRSGLGHVGLLGLRQEIGELLDSVPPGGVDRILEALAVSDAMAEMARRVAPRAVDPEAVHRIARSATVRIVERVGMGESPLEALRAEGGWHRGVRLAAPRPRARVAVIGEPWSLHVDGDGQLHLPQVLARAGAEMEVPPAVLWLEYLLWQVGEPRSGGRPALGERIVERARSASSALRHVCEEASEAVGMDPLDVPDPEELADLAAPHLPASFRGGYGHVEVGLAARALRDRRAHVVVSIKSFGCIPSAGVTDGIVPTVLRSEMPYLALEVCGDGEAARESRLGLRLAAAEHVAEEEFLHACGVRSVDPCVARGAMAVEPLACEPPGASPYACTLARRVLRHPSLPRTSAWAPGPE